MLGSGTSRQPPWLTNGSSRRRSMHGLVDLVRNAPCMILGGRSGSSVELCLNEAAVGASIRDRVLMQGCPGKSEGRHKNMKEILVDGDEICLGVSYDELWKRYHLSMLGSGGWVRADVDTQHQLSYEYGSQGKTLEDILTNEYSGSCWINGFVHVASITRIIISIASWHSTLCHWSACLEAPGSHTDSFLMMRTN